MLKQIKTTNEKILKKHFEQAFGENSKVTVGWGFPIINIEIVLNEEKTKTVFKLAFNSEDENYELSTYAIRFEDDKEVADFATISSQIINFIIKSSVEITEQFFTTKNYDPDAKQPEENQGEMAAEAFVEPETSESKEESNN